MDKVKAVTQDTLVPLALVAVIGSGIYYIAGIESRVKIAEMTNADQNAAIAQLGTKQEVIGDLKTRMSVMESKIDYITQILESKKHR
jgi:hypothetical protein